MAKLLMGVYRDQRVQFKLDISFGFMLRHRVNGGVRYFHASHNNHRLFERPYVIGSRQDMDEFVQRFKTSDIGELVTREREDSAWVLEYVTSVSIYANKVGDFPLVGAPPADVPIYIKKNKHSVSMTHHPKANRLFKDNLCLFRCLAHHLKSGDAADFDETPKTLFTRYQVAVDGRDGVSTFKGVSFQELGGKVFSMQYLRVRIGTERSTRRKRKSNPPFSNRGRSTSSFPPWAGGCRICLRYSPPVVRGD
ncbi:hypothetical protein HOLleu_01320 [Holothuria leucospilota]|uniref:Uncharacterized protein n=1 Tax=Holothuria leucospilota TaxID=206669 RepID=A0A9Q1CPT2_HOLLE|nr:hypothetical protein HOLleu_01320 [Holothuria leucospilota]